MSEVSHDGDRIGGGDPPAHRQNDWRRRYWKKNLRIVIALLAVWFTVSYGFSILLIEPLNNIVIGGFPLGLWWAQQGSIITFVILVLAYAVLMDRLDKQFGVDEGNEDGGRA